MPKLLEIDKIGVKARILRTAQTKSGAVGVPRNIFDTSWYENSVIPGETGTSLIIGHNHGPTSEGVFWNLAKMSHGDTVKITYGSGLQKTFKVVSLESRKAQDVDMARILASTTSEAKLFLMSCSGKYDKTSDSYLDRLVVELNLVQ
jgi:sortase (surface protein transpeptidase)